MSRLAGEVGARLEALAEPSVRAWWEGYLKGAVPFRGVRMAGVRQVVHELRDAWTLDAALAQFAQRCAEDKLAGILAIAELLLPGLSAADAPRLAEPFERGHVDDWSTCDWYCVKALGKLIRQDPAAAPAIAAWRDAPGLWQRRAAAVAFVDLVPHGEHAELVLAVCERNVADPARFSQTSVGWVLRELARARPELVDDFIERNRPRMSAEALRQTKRSSARSSSAASP